MWLKISMYYCHLSLVINEGNEEGLGEIEISFVTNAIDFVTNLIDFVTNAISFVTTQFSFVTKLKFLAVVR